MGIVKSLRLGREFSTRVIIAYLAGTALAACSSGVVGGRGAGGETGIGGTPTGEGGSSAGGAGAATGGAPASGGGTSTGEGGSAGGGGAGGTGATGGSTGTGGVVGTGGATGSGGSGGAGNVDAGRGGTGGMGRADAGRGTGGSPGTGGTISVDGGTGPGTPVDCTAAPLTGGTVRTSANAQGTAAGQSWSIWSNGAAGTITTYSAPAFSASWNNSGDFLARMGLEWGNSGKTFDQFGTITAQFAETKTGTAGGFSYVAVYGWSNNPCIEYYIIDDSYNRMPVNPGNTTNKGTATIDGSAYTLYTRPTTGTGGSRCGASVASWTQFYSVRQTARQCGQISITEHFKAWAAAGMTLGTMLEAKLLIEVGGGTGSIDFTTASVTAQ